MLAAARPFRLALRRLSVSRPRQAFSCAARLVSTKSQVVDVSTQPSTGNDLSQRRQAFSASARLVSNKSQVVDVSAQASTANDGQAEPSLRDMSLKKASADTVEPREPELDLAERARELGVALSPWEVRALVKKVLGNNLGAKKRSLSVTPRNLQNFVSQSLTKQWERETLVRAISETHAGSPAQKMLTGLDFLGSTLFAIVGTWVAGDAGMNVVGATLVGCISAMGGGTVNNIMMGNTKGGVFWMRDPRFLYVTIAASVITFYLWPQCEVWLAHRELEAIQEKHDSGRLSQLDAVGFLQDGGTIDLQRFILALEADPALAHRIQSVVEPMIRAERAAGIAPDWTDVTHADMFYFLDRNGDGQLGSEALQRFVRLKTDSSTALYIMDSVALGAFGVIGAQHGIGMGMPPAVCMVSGITICFGGIIRDLLCHRNLAFGGQSYAMATGCGAMVYVSMRQLVLRGVPIPLMYRILAGVGTTVGLRILDQRNSLLAPMSRPEI